jgi:hypothetical protein
MIDHKELMPNNLIKVKNKETVIECANRFFVEIAHEDKKEFDVELLEDCKPINITPARLKKCGIREAWFNSFVTLNGLDIKYIHEAQNLKTMVYDKLHIPLEV